MKLSTTGVALSSLVLLTGLALLPGCGDESKASKDSASEKKDAKSDKKEEKKDAKKEEGDAKPASAKPEADKKAEPTDAKAEGKKKVTKTEADSGAPACGKLNEVPAIPDTDSKPPTVEEWNKACKVNTQGANSHPDDCEMKILREWVRVTCRGEYAKVQNMESFGAVGVDYFEMIKPNELISYTLKLKKGRNQKVRMCKKDKMASLFVSWPTGEEKPLHIALARAGKCD